MTPALLSLDGLRVSADGRTIGPVSLDLAAGEFAALLGPSGSGKRLILRAVAGLAAVEAGSVRFEGRALSRLAAHDVARMGVALVPRTGRVFQRLTVLENLELGAFARRESRLSGEYEHVFSHFPVLGKRRSELAGALSRGERMMLAIGRALMAHPRLLLLDEPSAGLAPVAVERLLEILGRVNAEGLSVLVAEQTMLPTLGRATRGWALEAGRLVAAGSAAELLARDDLRRSLAAF